MRVRIIVLNWNGRRWLEGCFGALDAQRTPDVEVVLADNASTDGSAGFVRQRFPWVRVIALDRNAGFSHGNNIAAAGTAAEYLVFLNNDTEAAPGWLAALVGAADADPAVGLVTSRIVFLDDPDRVDSAGDGYLRCGGAFKRAHGRRAAQAGLSGEVFGACGAAFLIRRSLFEAIGGFDERFFMVYEDVDLSYRARLRGARVLYAADAVVRHAGSASLGRVSPEAVFYGQRNLEWTWLQNTPRRLLWRSVLPHLAYTAAAGAAYARQGLFRPWLRGKIAACAGVPRTLARRRAIQRAVRIDPETLWRLMEPNWIDVKRREKGFDFTAAR